MAGSRTVLQLRTPDPRAPSAPAKPHVLLVGSNADVAAMLEQLRDVPCVFTIAGDIADVAHGLHRQPELIMAALTHDTPLAVREAGILSAVPWIAWDRANDAAHALAAYEAGARAVLPGDVTALALRSLLQSTLTQTQARTSHRRPDIGHRQYPRGTRILLHEDEVLRVASGVVAQRVIHTDGSDVLIGLFGPDQLLVGHPDDSCCLDLIAHDETVAVVRPWTEAAGLDGFSAGLRKRLRHVEAWAAVQARPHLSVRIVGLLSLLADQFGRPGANGVVVDVRLTHGQLAAAVGATRATVTRALGALKRRRLVWTSGSGPSTRFCLRAREIHGHSQ